MKSSCKTKLGVASAIRGREVKPRVWGEWERVPHFPWSEGWGNPRRLLWKECAVFGKDLEGWGGAPELEEEG